MTRNGNGFGNGVHHGRPPGRVIGTAGGGLVGAGSTWAANAHVAKLGEDGEKATARILDPIALAPGGPTVIHDVRIPIPKFTANIDHIVVSGNTIHLIDAKSWAAGRYVRAPKFLGGKVYRDWKRFEPGEKQTMQMALEAMTRFMVSKNVRCTFATPIVVVWPTSTKKSLNMSFFSMTGANMINSARLAAFAKRYKKTANPAIVAALMSLVNGTADHNTPVPAFRPEVDPFAPAPDFSKDEFGVSVSDRRFPNQDPFNEEF